MKDIYYSFDKISEADNQLPNTTPISATILDYLSLLLDLGILPHELHLKPTMICSLARNLSIERGLVKNAHVIIERYEQHSIRVRLLHTHNTSNINNTTEHTPIIPLPRITFNFTPKFSS